MISRWFYITSQSIGIQNQFPYLLLFHVLMRVQYLELQIKKEHHCHWLLVYRLLVHQNHAHEQHHENCMVHWKKKREIKGFSTDVLPARTNIVFIAWCRWYRSCEKRSSWKIKEKLGKNFRQMHF